MREVNNGVIFTLLISASGSCFESGAVSEGIRFSANRGISNPTRIQVKEHIGLDLEEAIKAKGTRR